MHEKLTGTVLGSAVGFIGGLTTDKIVEVIVLSLIGGVMGAIGASIWRYIRNKINKEQNNDRQKS